jgi:hypothetical protein
MMGAELITVTLQEEKPQCPFIAQNNAKRHCVEEDVIIKKLFTFKYLEDEL